ncbi:D-2-hydroxyacid dehydrogenase [Paraburkholderia acidisoli]|uniref:D-2-hydroxyacid dehydrogenase n=2 Tax=Paraburkholderia acidisoli TaxID=2571748 RepID=A0A7Z2GPQ4_9BURK|nr:D-2-hydroxyacid dehydrogenase [Paraburkholderia acidisoli]
METMPPLNILISDVAAERFHHDIARTLDGAPFRLLTPDDDAHAEAQIAFVSRDVTGHSTKHELTAATRRFYDAMLGAPQLRWVHAHSAGADRPVFHALLQRSVRVTTSSGANARTVAHSALAGVLALARRLPLLHEAQREHAWRPLLLEASPRDLAGQTAVLVGYGAIGRKLAMLLEALEMNVIVVRREAPANAETLPRSIALANIDRVLPHADWLVLACPLTPQTHGLVDAKRLALMPRGAHLVNVARGEVIVETDLIAALRDGGLAGAYLDVFEHEPLTAASPLWDLPNVILTPHMAGQSDSYYDAVGRLWLDNLARWCRGEPLVNEAH